MQGGGSVSPERGGVLQPLLQQPDRPSRQRQRFRRRAALDVGQQHGGVPGPVDVPDPEPGDAVRDDPGIDAQQQAVGDHHARAGEQDIACRPHPAVPVDPCPAAAEVCAGPLVAHRAEPHQQPPLVIGGPSAVPRVLAPGCRPERLPVPGECLVNVMAAGLVQPVPLLWGVGNQRRAGRPGREVTPGGQRVDAWLQRAAFAGGVEGGQHPPGQRLVRTRRPASSTRPAARGKAGPAPLRTPRSRMNPAMSRMPAT